MTNTTKTIAVIGGGCTGTLWVIDLARQLKNRTTTAKLHLHLFDPDGFANGGIAYGRSKGLLLNETADAMSPWNPGSFASWCREHGLNPNPKHFHERQTFGAFLQTEYKNAVSWLRQQGHRVGEHDDTVNHITRDGPGKFNLGAGPLSLHRIPAQNIVIASGYGAGTQFDALNKHRSTGYIPSLYASENLDDVIPERARILILGTGPGFHDALRLLAPHHPAAILAVSPNGTLPERRDLRHEGTETRLILSDDYNLATTARQLEHLIQDDLAKAEERGSTKRRAALDIQKHLPGLLHQISAAERHFFVKGSLSRLFHACTPVPEESHNLVVSLQENETLSFHKGRLEQRDILRAATGFRVRIDGACRIFDVVINCTGHNPLNQKLIKTLLASNLAKTETGLPVLATREDGISLAGSNIICLGPATNIGLDGVESFYPGIVRSIEKILAAPPLPPQPPSSRNHPQCRR